MTKIKKLIERNYQKKLKYAEQRLLERDYNSAEKLFLSCYNHYKAENNSLMISRILLLLSDIGTVSQRVMNRARSEGPYGIWGHYLSELWIERISYNPQTRTVKLFIGS